ncbi:proline-rich protein HaeIII subfamily 1-like [Iris pallida]|uniref:Proline-rich protein HaeIII subfamily 1-like n=1 Tax=Iris pallida TaxID=29817 RepID=A0AAX6DK43_IRIPA|nr:proline-rich protein HaeIII subfamily 1-like [Iris pallida]
MHLYLSLSLNIFFSYTTIQNRQQHTTCHHHHCSTTTYTPPPPSKPDHTSLPRPPPPPWAAIAATTVHSSISSSISSSSMNTKPTTLHLVNRPPITTTFVVPLPGHASPLSSHLRAQPRAAGESNSSCHSSSTAQ